MCCVPCPAQFPTAPTVTSHAERWTRAWGRAAPGHKTPPKPAPVRVLAVGPCRQRQGGREPWCAPGGAERGRLLWCWHRSIARAALSIMAWAGSRVPLLPPGHTQLWLTRTPEPGDNETGINEQSGLSPGKGTIWKQGPARPLRLARAEAVQEPWWCPREPCRGCWRQGRGWGWGWGGAPSTSPRTALLCKTHHTRARPR